VIRAQIGQNYRFDLFPQKRATSCQSDAFPVASQVVDYQGTLPIFQTYHSSGKW
jgi:hypothetical protein